MKIKSEHIQVYPTSFRDKVGTRNYNPESRLNTEFNLTNRFRFLGNDDYAASGSKSGSFVVSWDSTSKILIFLIHGYYFKATLSANDYSSLFSNPSSGDIIWGQIKILPFTTSEDSNTKYKAYTLVNTDASGSTTAGASLDNIPSGESVAKFEGVALTRGTEPAASSTTYTLALLKYNYAESRWEIPETSKLIIPSTAVKNTDGSPIHRKFTTDELSVGHISAEDYIESDKSVEGDKVYAAAKDGLRLNTGGSTSSSGVRHTVYPGALPLPVYTLDDGYRLDRDDSGGSVSPSHAPTTPILLSKFMSDFNLPATDDDEVFILNYICGHISINANSYGGYSESSYIITNTYWFMIEKGGLSVRLKCLSSRNSSESSSSVSTNPVNTTCYKLYWASGVSTTLKDQKMQDILNPEAWSTASIVFNKIKAIVISDKLMNVSTKNIQIEQINDHRHGVSFGNDSQVDDTKDSITHIRTYCVGEHHGANFGFGWYYGGSGNSNYYDYVDHTGKDYQSIPFSIPFSIPANCVWKLADIYVVHKKEGNTKSFHIYGIAWYEVHMKDADGNNVYILNPVGINVSRSLTPPGSGSYRSGFTIYGSGGSSNIPLKISEQLSDMYIPVVSIQRDPSLADLSVAVGSSITIPDSDIQISPDQASDKSFKLISLTPELASVSYDWNGSVTRREWKVRGVAAGTARIQIMSNDNTNATSTINVTVTAS